MKNTDYYKVNISVHSINGNSQKHSQSLNLTTIVNSNTLTLITSFVSVFTTVSLWQVIDIEYNYGKTKQNTTHRFKLCSELGPFIIFFFKGIYSQKREGLQAGPWSSHLILWSTFSINALLHLPSTKPLSILYRICVQRNF